MNEHEYSNATALASLRIAREAAANSASCRTESDRQKVMAAVKLLDEVIEGLYQSMRIRVTK